MMTPVATPPNPVVNSELLREGLHGFSFFSVTPIGPVVLIPASSICWRCALC